MTLPDFTAEIAFDSDFYDSPVVWTDVTDLFISANTEYGRGGPIDVCDPGTASFVFDNSAGHFDPDDINGPYYGNLRPNKLIRLSVTISATTYTLFTGYIDSLVRSWPGGSEYSECRIAATDRFKQLARSTYTGTLAAQAADDRITDLLTSVTFKTINGNSYACRTVAAHEYDGDDILAAAQEVARSDGGVLFVDTAGTVIFQPATFRQTNSRSTTSQHRFGNDATAIPIEADLSPAVDDALMANLVRLTDAAGLVHQEDDPAAALVDGLIELDLGSTMLDISSEADDRVIEVLNLLIDAKPRWQSITLDCLTTSSAAAAAVDVEISDRVTVAFIHPGKSYGYARDQYVESIAHEVSLVGGGQWTCTLGMSGLPGAASNGRTTI